MHHQLIQVTDAHCDTLGHVNNVAYVQWIQDVAESHCYAAGINLRQVLADTRCAFVIARHEIDYVRPAFPGMEIRVETWVERVRATVSLRRTRVLSAEGELLCRARTTWVFANIDTGKPARLSAEMRAALPAETPPA